MGCYVTGVPMFIFDLLTNYTLLGLNLRVIATKGRCYGDISVDMGDGGLLRVSM